MNMRYTLLAIVLVAMCSFLLPAKRTNTRPVAKPKLKDEYAATTKVTTHFTHLPADSAAFSLAGYDKPLRSRYETLLVTNNSTIEVDSLLLTIGYTDLQGRELHKRSVWVEANITPGSTRQCSFRSWDIQMSYVYRHSVKPRRQHTPYDVAISVDSLCVSVKN